MKTYRITIEPASAFGTPLKGDTIFGHICWRLAEDPSLLQTTLDSLLQDYDRAPFAVFSSAHPVLNCDDKVFYALPRPMGLEIANRPQSRRDRIRAGKEAKKRKWLLLDESLRIVLSEERFKSDQELFDLFLESRSPEEARPLCVLAPDKKRLCAPFTQSHNAINRMTMTTGGDGFAPFSHDNVMYLPGLSLAIFAAVDEQVMDPDGLRSVFERTGLWGFGRDASAGLGRFMVRSVEEQPWPCPLESDTGCYTLGPCVPRKKTFTACHAVPFTRFGRHGSALATCGAPFKKPIIMAQEGAVLYPASRELYDTPWLGTAVKNVSAMDPKTVTQGYTLYLPC